MRNLMRLAWRESRTARRKLLVYTSSISLGVAALVAIDSFSANTERSIREQSRALVGGDLVFTSRDGFSAAVRTTFDSIQASGVALEQVTTFASMATVPRSGGTRLAQVRAVSPGYPLYGEVVSSPAGVWNSLTSSRVALVDPGLLVSLDGKVGDTLRLGFAEFVIAGTIESMPGNPGVAAIVGPRVFISEAWLASTGLLGFGARAEYETVARLGDGVNPMRWVAPLRRALERERVRITTVQESEQELTDSVAQLSQFLGIVGLVALLLGGIGVASGVHAFVQRRIDTVAILRCLGATGWQVLAVYVAQAGVMGFVGAAMGAGLGVAIQFAAPSLVGDFLPVSVRVAFEPRVVLVGLAIGVWVALVFSLRPLLVVRRVSPLVTLRRDAETLGAARRRDALGWLVTLVLTLSVVALTYGRADDAREGFIFTVGVAGALAVLSASAWGLTVAARRSARWVRAFPVRQGFANLHRPANQTQSVVIALGFGAFLVSTLYLVQANLLHQFDITAEASRGNLVFFDVQDDQRAGVDSMVRASGHPVIQTAPIVTMRIARINGMPAADYAQGAGISRTDWALRREYRSSYRDTLVATETLIAGEWWQQTTRDTVFELSLEREIAERLQLDLGALITWDVQGVPITTRVTSIREVNWGRFEPNFFAVLEPEALRNAPQQHVVVAEVRDDAAIARLQRATVARYPNVASIDLSLVRNTLMAVVGRVASAVRFLALFSFAMGIPVLFSAVAATRRERLRESVLLKTLGATRVQVRRILLSEYAALGLLGAAAGLVLSLIGAWAVMRFVFESTFTVAPIAPFAIALVMTAMAMAIGGLTSREVFRATAMEALRQ